MKKLIENAKVCCGDIETEDCSQYCINPRDSRDGELRWCRQWLIHDLHITLSTLQAENAQLRESRDRWKRLAHELSEGVNGKDAEHERLQAENEKLRAELEQVKEKNAGLALALLTECAPNPNCLGSDEWRAIRAELDKRIK